MANMDASVLVRQAEILQHHAAQQAAIFSNSASIAIFHMPGLSGQHNDLAGSAFCLLPAAPQEFGLFFAIDEFKHLARRTAPAHERHTGTVPPSGELAQFKEKKLQPVRGCGGRYHTILRRRRLQMQRDILRLANRQLLSTSPCRDQHSPVAMPIRSAVASTHRRRHLAAD